MEGDKMNITPKFITRSALLLALAIAVQSFKLPQPVTGPLVNAILFLATATVGTMSGVIVGLFTPVLAFVFGIMTLFPAVPLIMAGNAVLALVYGILQKRPVTGIVAASLAKYALLTLGVHYVLPLFLSKPLPAKVISLLTTPQLFTALAGGVLAFLVLQGLSMLKKEKETNSNQ
jgi:hypothetical protein